MTNYVYCAIISPLKLKSSSTKKGGIYMPGYYVHSAVCNPNTRENLSFRRGVEAPDILKKYFKLHGIAGAKENYNTFLKTADMPDFSNLEERIQQKEVMGAGTGLHYGLSSKPDVMLCWNSLSPEERSQPFYRGYIWHLLTDYKIYQVLDIDAKFAKFMEINKGKSQEEITELKKQEVKKLHDDWDKTNQKIKDTYPDVSITPEVEELGVVQFIEEGPLFYVDWDALKQTIDYLRSFDPLNGNMDAIIAIIMQNL